MATISQLSLVCVDVCHSTLKFVRFSAIAILSRLSSAEFDSNGGGTEQICSVLAKLHVVMPFHFTTVETAESSESRVSSSATVFHNFFDVFSGQLKFIATKFVNDRSCRVTRYIAVAISEVKTWFRKLGGSYALHGASIDLVLLTIDENDHTVEFCRSNRGLSLSESICEG